MNGDDLLLLRLHGRLKDVKVRLRNFEANERMCFASNEACLENFINRLLDNLLKMFHEICLTPNKCSYELS
jgi:hypothetical protein